MIKRDDWKQFFADVFGPQPSSPEIASSVDDACIPDQLTPTTVKDDLTRDHLREIPEFRWQGSPTVGPSLMTTQGRKRANLSDISSPFLGIFSRSTGSKIFDTASSIPSRIGKMREIGLFRTHQPDVHSVCLSITNSDRLKMFTLRRNWKARSATTEYIFVPSKDSECIYLARTNQLVPGIDHCLTVTIYRYFGAPLVTRIMFQSTGPRSEEPGLTNILVSPRHHALVSLTNSETFYIPIN